MPIGSNILAGASGQATGYDIDQSLRFEDGDSAYLSRTPSSAGNRKTWTWSGWFKMGIVDGSYRTILGSGGGTSRDRIQIFADEQLVVNFNDSIDANLNTTQVFRDPAAWYHLVVAVDTTQSTASDRIKIYVNGEQISAFDTANYPTQNYDTHINNTDTQYIGQSSSNNFYWDGYLAEVHLIDGQALTPASFGETNADTNQWVPIKYTGSYPGNSFYLKFQDSSALGDDSSGNTNDFTSSGLASTDQVTDSPSQNHATLNPVDTGSGTLSEGNLKSTGTTDRSATFLLSSGKWAWKVTADAAGAFGVASNGLTGTESTHSASSSEVLEFELDLDANTLKVRVDGGSLTSVATGLTADAYVPLFKAACTCDFGQSGFSPTDGTFKTLNTDNLPDPSIADPTAHFNTILYDDGSGAKTGVGFQPDLVWVKSRGSAYEHELTDSVRGVTKALSSDSTNAETTDSTGLTAFGADGFTVGADTNYSDTTGSGMVAWNWKAGGTASSNTDGSVTSSVSANTDAGFSIVSFTGTGSNGTIGHGLSQAPELVIVKNRDTSPTDWQTGSDYLTSWAYRLKLNDSVAEASVSTSFNSTAPTASVVNIGSNSDVNNSTDAMIMYCFHSVDGYSKVGSYTGNSNADGTFVYTGFKPAYVLMKASSGSGHWNISDSARDPDNPVMDYSYANNTDVNTPYANWDFLSNGFKLRINDTYWNGSGVTYIYLAIADSPGPFKYSNAR